MFFDPVAAAAGTLVIIDKGKLTLSSSGYEYAHPGLSLLAQFSSLSGCYEPAQLLDVSTPINRTCSPPSDLVTVGVK